MRLRISRGNFDPEQHHGRKLRGRAQRMQDPGCNGLNYCGKELKKGQGTKFRENVARILPLCHKGGCEHSRGFHLGQI